MNRRLITSQNLQTKPLPNGHVTCMAMPLVMPQWLTSTRIVIIFSKHNCFVYPITSVVLCDTMDTDIMQPEHVSRSLERTKHIIVSCTSQSYLQLAACCFHGHSYWLNLSHIFRCIILLLVNVIASRIFRGYGYILTM